MHKILYLEDEPFLGQVVVDALVDNNFKVTWAKSGDQALKNFDKDTFDICLLDVMVPGKDGHAVAKDIRRKNAAIPIVFITAKSQGSDVVEGFEAGGTEYIKKPFSLDELMARINNQLRLSTGRVSTDEEMSFGKFTINIQRLRLMEDGVETHKLTHRECEILKRLVESSNDTVERKNLLNEVWGDDSYYNSRNLDVYIKKLRNYLASDDSVEIITLKGLGYKLVC